MGRQNWTENIDAPVKFPYVHSQLELRSLLGLLIRIFSKQALATRYLPDLEDARSTLPYLKLVHKSVWYLRPGSRQLVVADAEGCMASSANLSNLSSAVWTGFSESTVMRTRSCPKFSWWLRLRMSEILFPASAQNLQVTTCHELGMIPLHRYILPYRQQISQSPSWNCEINSLLCIGLPQTFLFSMASKSFYGRLCQDQHKGRGTGRRYSTRRPHGVFLQKLPQDADLGLCFGIYCKTLKEKRRIFLSN